MDHHELILFLLQVATMLAVALAGGFIMRKLRQPAVLGELIGGIFLGPTVFGFFAPLYFVSIGLKANFAANFDGSLVLLVLFVACTGKIIGAGVGAWLGGMAVRESLAVGFGMNARGAMEIILASVALEYGLIDQRIFVALVIMAVVTSMISGPAMQHLLKRPLAERPAVQPLLDR